MTMWPLVQTVQAVMCRPALDKSCQATILMKIIVRIIIVRTMQDVVIFRMAPKLSPPST